MEPYAIPQMAAATDPRPAPAPQAPLARAAATPSAATPPAAEPAPTTSRKLFWIALALLFLAGGALAAVGFGVYRWYEASGRTSPPPPSPAPTSASANEDSEANAMGAAPSASPPAATLLSEPPTATTTPLEEPASTRAIPEPEPEPEPTPEAEAPAPAGVDPPAAEERSSRRSRERAETNEGGGTASGASSRRASAEPSDPLSLATRALRSGDPTGCVDVLDDLIAHGATPAALRRRGDCLLRLGDRAEAIRDYQRFCRLAPDHPAINEVREVLEGLGQSCP